ncbi:MAG: hypothetical protein ABSG51_15370 [Terracidiphilus sp.]
MQETGMNIEFESSDSSHRHEQPGFSKHVTVIGGAAEHPFQEEIAAKAISDHVDPPQESRFRIFVIDTCWNSVASRVLRENLNLFFDLNREEPTYLLGRDASVALLRQYESLIGRDPIIIVHDMQVICDRGTDGVHGLRLHLGLMQTETQALTGLQMFARFLRTHRAAKNLESEVRGKLLLEGLAGAIQIVGGAPQNILISA